MILRDSYKILARRGSLTTTVVPYTRTYCNQGNKSSMDAENDVIQLDRYQLWRVRFVVLVLDSWVPKQSNVEGTVHGKAQKVVGQEIKVQTDHAPSSEVVKHLSNDAHLNGIGFYIELYVEIFGVRSLKHRRPWRKAFRKTPNEPMLYTAARY